MSTLQTSRNVVMAYADSWKNDHVEAMACFDIQEKIQWGIFVYRFLSAVASSLQASVLRSPGSVPDTAFDEMRVSFQYWLQASCSYRLRIDPFVRSGYQIDGLEDFDLAIEEAEAVIGNGEVANELPPIEALMPLFRPENPDLARYGA